MTGPLSRSVSDAIRGNTRIAPPVVCPPDIEKVPHAFRLYPGETTIMAHPRGRFVDLEKEHLEKMERNRKDIARWQRMEAVCRDDGTVVIRERRR